MLIDHGGYRDWNPASLALFAMPEGASLQGVHPADLSPPYQPDGQPSREAATALIEQAFQEGEAFFEWQHCTWHGNAFTTEVLLSRIQLPEGPILQTVVRDISDRKAAEATLHERERELEQARVEAEAASRAKDDLLATVSHELRTPLTTVLGSARLLEDESLSAESRWALESLAGAARHLRGLIDQLLDTSRAEAGTIEIAAVPFDPDELLRDQLAMMSPEARDKGLALERHGSELPEALTGDPVRIGEILNNLLANAVRATSEGAVILNAEAHTLDEERVRLVVAVSDTGPGVDEATRASLFEPFAAGRTAPGSLGLGLAIAKRLAQAMGGTLEVSNDPGAGSRFTLTLVLPRAEAPPALADRGLSELHLLLVEDHPVNRRLLADLLERDGHIVTVTAHAEEALAALDQGPVDAVLTDLHLPDRDGCALARAIHARPTEADLPVIAVTANASADALERVRSAGLDGLLTKPPDLQRLYTILSDALAGRAQTSANGASVPAPPAPDRPAVSPRSEPAGVPTEAVADARDGLASALAAGDTAAVAKAAHRLAGVAAFAGCSQVAEHACRIEDVAAEGDLAAAYARFQALPRG